MQKEVNISILARNEILREGLRRILADESFKIQSSVPDQKALMAETREGNSPHLIIVDSTTAAEGASICRQLRQTYPSSRLVLMADDYSVENVARAFAAGVDGYLVKAISCEPLVGALRLIALGEKVLPSQFVDSLVDPLWRTAPQTWETDSSRLNLSDREIEILRCLISGSANKQISRQLNITEATVKVHIKAILRKLRVMNRTQAAIWAVTRGLNQDVPATAASATQH